MTPGLHFVTREGASESWSRYRGWRLLLHWLAHLAIKAIVTAAEHNSYVCFVLFLFCFYISVRVCLQIQGALRECRSIRSGVRRPPYHCVPLGTDFAEAMNDIFNSTKSDPNSIEITKTEGLLYFD